MREANWRDQLVDRLQRYGCPALTTKRVLQEIDDHHADLKAEGLERGCTEAEAESYARQRLGPPEELAHRFIRTRRQTDWWGRHPKLLFGFAPLLILILSFAGASLLLALLGSIYGWWDKPSTLSHGTWMTLTMLVPLFQFALAIVLPLLICRLANYYCYGWRWALFACWVLSVHGYFHNLSINFPFFGEEGFIAWGYGISSQPSGNLWLALPPVLIFTSFYLETIRLRLRAYYANHKS